MPPIPSTRPLYQRITRRRMDTELGRLFQPMTNRLRSLVTAQGEIIDPRQQNAVTASAGQIVMSMFVGADNRNAYGPDGITPLSPFAMWLNREIASVQADVVIAHARYMGRHLPAEVLVWLRGAQTPVSEQRQHLSYIPTHEWLDQRGFTLSDRIWQTGERTRAKIDALLRDGIRQGRGSLDIAADLERFIQPGRVLRITQKPYGIDASFDAMRLARTEIAFAHAQASYKASQDNPFVEGIDVALSNRHPKPDICDDLATLDDAGQRLREPYGLDSAELPPFHPHCLCNTRPAQIMSRQDVIDLLRARMDGPAPLTPAAPRLYILELLGGLLGAYISTDRQRDLQNIELEEGFTT